LHFFPFKLLLQRLVRLANGLEALVISDPEADKAAAALTVRVGHLSDPVSSNMFSPAQSQCSQIAAAGKSPGTGPFLRTSSFHGNGKGDFPLLKKKTLSLIAYLSIQYPSENDYSEVSQPLILVR
jgi:hypothetical protein